MGHIVEYQSWSIYIYWFWLNVLWNFFQQRFGAKAAFFQYNGTIARTTGNCFYCNGITMVIRPGRIFSFLYPVSSRISSLLCIKWENEINNLFSGRISGLSSIRVIHNYDNNINDTQYNTKIIMCRHFFNSFNNRTKQTVNQNSHLWKWAKFISNYVHFAIMQTELLLGLLFNLNLSANRAF